MCRHRLVQHQPFVFAAPKSLFDDRCTPRYGAHTGEGYLVSKSDQNRNTTVIWVLVSRSIARGPARPSICRNAAFIEELLAALLRYNATSVSSIDKHI